MRRRRQFVARVFFCCCCLLLTIVQIVGASKILFLYCHSSTSHLGSMAPFIKTLASAGHNVTVLQTGAEARPRRLSATIATVVWRLNDTLDLEAEIDKVVWPIVESSIQFNLLTHAMASTMAAFIEQVPGQIRELLNEEWDALVVDTLFTHHGYAFATILKRHRNVPYIVFDTTFNFRFQAWPLGFGGSWSAHPSTTVPVPVDSQDYFRPTSLRDRLHNFYQFVGEVVGTNVALTLFSFHNLERLGARDFSMPKFTRDSALILSDEIRGYGHTTPRTLRLQIAGAYCSKASELPLEIRTFVEDKSSKGTIYIAFGTMVNFKYAPQFALDALFGALNELRDYRILFVYRGEAAPRDVQSHVRLLDWAPQFDILSHPNTKLFISHGGLKSLKEAICSNTPMCIMPFFAEQSHNAKVALSLGVATILNKYTLTKEVVAREILEVLENEKYAKNMQKLHDQFLDHPVSQLEEARFHTERIIRKRGQNLRLNHQGEHISTFDAFYADLILVIIALIMIVSAK